MIIMNFNNNFLWWREYCVMFAVRALLRDGICRATRKVQSVFIGDPIMKYTKIAATLSIAFAAMGAGSVNAATLPVYTGPAINYNSSPACLAIGDGIGLRWRRRQGPGNPYALSAARRALA